MRAITEEPFSVRTWRGDAKRRGPGYYANVMPVETRKANLSRPDFIPTSFEEMFDHYYDYVVRLVYKSGIDFQNSEDVAMSILTRFYERDALSFFDADHTTNHGGVERRAVFRTFLSGFVRDYVQHYRDRQRIRQDREGLSTDTVMFVYAQSGEAATWLDLNAPQHEDTHDTLYEWDLVRSIRDHLAQVPRRNAQDQCDLAKFFEAVLRQTHADGRVDTILLAKEFGVSKASAQNWLKRLRAEVAKVIETR